ncbi:MAG: hypothetical protein V1845_00635 [bacterium]
MEKFENQKEERDRIDECREFFAPFGYQFFHAFLYDTYELNNGLVSYRELETKFDEYLNLFGKETKHVIEESEEPFKSLSDKEIKKFIIYASIDEAVKCGKKSGLNPAGKFKDKPARYALRDLTDYLGILSDGFPAVGDIEKGIQLYKEQRGKVKVLSNNPMFGYKKDVNLVKIEDLDEAIASMENNLKKEKEISQE